MKPGLALFDFDGTITVPDTFMEIIKFQKGKVAFYLGMSFLSPVLFLYMTKLIKNWRSKEIVLGYFFGGMLYTDFQQKCDEFIIKKLPAMLRPEAMQKIYYHLAQNDRVIVVSASPGNWIAGWCKAMNIELLATSLEVKNDRVTGKLKSLNCYGQEKVNRINAHLDLKEYKTIYAYGDTAGDLPMLSLAHHAFFRKF